jgi:hypothetical protein
MDKFTHSFFHVIFAVVKLPLFVFILIGMISAARHPSGQLAPVRANRLRAPLPR